jgi:tetratricopeptide (TPR) repeat protein
MGCPDSIISARMHSPLHIVLFCLLLTVSLGAKADVYSDVNQLVRSEQWAKARTQAEAHLKTQPTDPQMRLLLSRIQDGQGQTALAMESLQVLTQYFHELPEPHNNLAALLARADRHEEALQSLQAAVRARPDYALALENMGDLYLALAARAYGQALNLTPTLRRLQNKQANTQQVLKAP